MDPVQSVSLSNVSVKRPKKVRCAYELCGRALTFLDTTFKCFCKNSYCPKHRLPECHQCKELDKLKEKSIAELAKQLGQPKSKKEKFGLI